MNSNTNAAVPAPSLLQFDDPEGVSTEIPENERMYAGYREHYFSVGRSALSAIRLAMATAGISGANRILDLPCGHGRVLRWLRAAFPQATLTACDILTDGVDYCAKAFAATPVYSVANPAEISLQSEFDLIWCGSLFTHLDEDVWRQFLNLFQKKLAPRGLVIFTTHGRHVRKRLRGDEDRYGLAPANVAHVLESYERSGFGYADYHGQRGYGISLSSPSWVCTEIERRPGLRLVIYTERGWDNHQDVVALIREDTSFT